jgi:hypothetical protein
MTKMTAKKIGSSIEPWQPLAVSFYDEVLSIMLVAAMEVTSYHTGQLSACKRRSRDFVRQL